MADRIVTEKFLDELILFLVTATHSRPYIQVNNMVEAIHKLPDVPMEPADDKGAV